jgi:hypothetical protein
MQSTAKYLKSLFNATAALGDKVVSSDATFEIVGHEHLTLLVKQFPWPELSAAGEIEVPMPVGSARWQPQQLKVNQQGQVMFMETIQGHVGAFLEEILMQGGRFDAKVYEGTPENYSRVESIYDCFVQLDNPDRDFENRSQIMTISGTLFFHYFGKTK